jgi:hypothetical protein
MRASVLGRILLLVALVAGCGSDSNNPPAPQLVKFLVVVPGEMDLDLLTPPDGGLPAAVSGAASFKLVFNQLLDGDKIETVSGSTVTPKTDVASIVWTNAPAGAPAITAATSYDPSGAAGITQPAPKIFINASPGLPSGAQLQVKLDRSKVTGKKGAPFVGPDTQMVATLPFSASASVSDGQALFNDMPLQVAFTNVPAMNVSDHIQLATAGLPVMIQVTPDAMDPRKVTVAPMTWMPSAQYTLTVDKDAADLFGVKLTAGLSVTFFHQIAGVDAGAPEAGPSEDGGGDAAGADASAPDAGAAEDASPDAAGTDAAVGG